MAEGEVRIDAVLVTNKFDRQIVALEKKIEKTEKDQVEIDAEIKGVKETVNNYKQLQDELIKTEFKLKRLKELKDDPGGLTASQYFSLYNPLIEKQQELVKEIRAQNSEYAKAETKLSKLTAKKAELADKANDYKAKVESVKYQKSQSEIDKMKEGFNGIGSSIQSAIKKVSMLALGVFGLRSAYMAVRRASSELASYNPQYAANLEYIRYALTQAIAPVLEYIVNLARTALAYINYIAQAWFGVNLFANASAKSFEKIKNSVGGASASAKELRKTLAGFDEMNILNSSSTGGGGGVGGGGISPDFDLSDLSDIKIPDWVEKIAKNKDKIIGAIKAIAEAFLIFKVLQIAKILSGVEGSIVKAITSLTTLNKVLLGLGVAAIIAGIVIAVESLIKWFKDPTWDNFKGVLYGLELAAAGLAAVLIALNASNPIGWVILGIDAVASLTTVIFDLTASEKKEKTAEEKLQESMENLKRARENLTNVTKEYIGAVDGAEEAEKRLQEAQDNTGISIDDLLRKMQKENLSYKDLTEAEREVYKAYVDNTEAQKELTDQTIKAEIATRQEKNALYQLIGQLRESSSSHEDYKKKVVDAWKSGKINAQEASEAISVALAEMDDKSRDVFTKDLPSDIKKGLDPNNYQNVANNFKNWWNNSVYGRLKTHIDFSINALNRTGSGTTYSKMATGGIVNMPNTGTVLGTTTLVGEAGREGVIPLTDQQAMSELGREIGKNVMVNLTNIMNMNGRVIGRELRQVQSTQDFAYNG